MTSVTGDSWPTIDNEVKKLGGPEEPVSSYAMPELEQCNLLSFKPVMEIATDTQAASTPTGMSVTVKVPQEGTLSAEGLAEADIQNTTLVLPEGVHASPAAAGGLLACSVSEVGFTGKSLASGVAESLEELTDNHHFSDAGVSCPAASKIGTVEVHTPLLKNSLTGSVYLASQDTNPFASPLVLYVFAEDPESGVKVKLAGEVHVSEEHDGQLTSVFRETPPVPFDKLTLHLFGGGRASQSTPPLCGEYKAEATFMPDSGGAAVTEQPGFQITSGPEGGPCPSNPLPFSPSVSAGPTSNQAAGFTHFTVALGHPDSNQPIDGLDMHLPPGSAAMLSSVTPCPIAQADAAQCGPESLIGHATSVTGLGSEPFSLHGNVYLTGPYDNAPFGISVATSAEHAGPFNLGMVIANSTIQVDPNTAAVTITAIETRVLEPTGHTTVLATALPTMIKGVPVQLKALNVVVDREGFEFNPTNCSGSTITGSLSGAGGGSSSFSSPYVVDNCATLPFNPGLTATAGGHYSRVTGTNFIVRVAAKPGEANIAKTKLVIPEELPSRQTTLEKACLAATFAANPASCSPESIIGEGVVHTPVLKNELRGPAYLVSYGAAKFPDVEFVLQGEGILLILDGQTNIHNGVTTSSFNSVPDAPVSTFEANLPTGPKSILTGYSPLPGQSICADKLSIATTITGQNGAVLERSTPVALTGCAGVAHFTETKAQKLTKALKSCRSKFKKKKKKRLACERAARKKFGPKPKPRAKSHKKK